MITTRRIAIFLLALLLLLSLTGSLVLVAYAQDEGPAIDADVQEANCNSGSFDLGIPHLWLLRGEIPIDIGSAKSYIISDTLDYRLSYELDSAEAMLLDAGGTLISLKKGIHYQLSEGTASAGGYIVDEFQLTMTADGISFIAARLEDKESPLLLQITFRASINQYAATGNSIPNTAKLTYIDEQGTVWTTSSDSPEVHTGGLNILKTDALNNPLPGASYMIAREATQEELESFFTAKEILSVGEEELAVIYVDFCQSANLALNKVYTTTTNEEGWAGFYGLAYGTYYLVETQSPEGFGQVSQPIPIIINEVSHLTAADGWMDRDGHTVDHTLHLVAGQFSLPDTGCVGGLLMALAAILSLCCGLYYLTLPGQKR